MTSYQTAILKLQQLPEPLIDEVNQFIDQLIEQKSSIEDVQHDSTLTKSMQAMAKKSFAKIWDNDDDAEYDNL